jgi:hypothetical protein
MMALILAFSKGETVSAYCRLLSSTHNFRQYFHDLGKSDVNTIERVVFSLVLANSKTPEAQAGTEMPLGRS